MNVIFCKIKETIYAIIFVLVIITAKRYELKSKLKNQLKHEYVQKGEIKITK